MSERTKLLKKAVLTGVGATTSVDRIKSALEEAMNDLVKVGQDLLEDLEDKGKNRTEGVQNFLKNLKDEAEKRTYDVEKKVSGKVQVSMKKAAKDIGLVTREDWDELIDRLAAIEEHVGVTNSDEETEGKKSRKKKASSN
ncbi:MAG TPA: hypothetical protein V6D17_18595 [Candidatus Obscuribacterales bacterium]